MTLFTLIATYLHKQLEISQACAAFQQMDNAMLHDLGIERCQIGDIVRGAVRA